MPVLRLSGASKAEVDELLAAVRDELAALSIENIKELNNLNEPIAVHQARACIRVTRAIEAAKYTPPVVLEAARPIVFMFSGFGSHWEGMGCGLYSSHEFPIFRKTIDDLHNHLLNTFCNSDLSRMFSSATSLALNPEYMFLSHTAFQIAFVDTLNEAGIYSTAAFGQSIGELGSLYACGLISKFDAVSISYLVGQSAYVNADDNETGQTLIVFMDVEALKAILPTDVQITCINTDRCVLVGGRLSAMGEFESKLKSLNVTSRTLDTRGVVFHSPLTVPTKDKLLMACRKHGILQNGADEFDETFISTSVPNGRKITSGVLDYCANNLINPVLLSQCFDRLRSQSIVIEIGPSAFLGALVSALLKKSDSAYLSCSIKGGKDAEQIKALEELIENVWMMGGYGKQP